MPGTTMAMSINFIGITARKMNSNGSHIKPTNMQQMQLQDRQVQLFLTICRYFSTGFAPIFPDTCYHLTHYWLAAVDIPVASDNPVHYADAIRYNARTPLQGSLLPLTRLVWA